MISINLITQGILAAAGNQSTGSVSQLIPAPYWIAGQWWSFMNDDDGSIGATIDPIRSTVFPNSSLDTFNDVGVSTGITAIGEAPINEGNGVVLRAGGSFLGTKNLTPTTEPWVTTNISSVPGGHIGGGANFIHYSFNTNQFILRKGVNKDLYTSPDAQTWTAIDPVDDNDLSLVHDFIPSRIWHNGTLYVAQGYFVAQPDTLASMTSPDLSVWTDTGVTLLPGTFPNGFEKIVYFSSRWIMLVTINDLKTFYTSTDLINWALVFTSSKSADDTLDSMLKTATRLSYHGSIEVYTDDGVTFIERLPVANVTTILGIINEGKNNQLRGMLNNADNDTGPTFLSLRTGRNTLNGKALFEVDPITYTAVAKWPIEQVGQDIIGLLGETVGDRYTTIASTFLETWYAKDKSGIGGTSFMFEVTVEQSNSADVRIGVTTVGFNPATRPLDSGKNGRFWITGDNTSGQAFREDGGGQVLVGDSGPIDTGDTYQFVFRPVADDKFQVYRNGVLAIDLLGVTSNHSWVPFLEANTSRVRINLGQEPFSFPIAGTLPWV